MNTLMTNKTLNISEQIDNIALAALTAGSIGKIRSFLPIPITPNLVDTADTDSIGTSLVHTF